jgi:hypothetical protein
MLVLNTNQAIQTAFTELDMRSMSIYRKTIKNNAFWRTKHVKKVIPV